MFRSHAARPANAATSASFRSTRGTLGNSQGVAYAGAGGSLARLGALPMPEDATRPERRAWQLPPVGGNPSSSAQGTSPGSFAARARIGSAIPFGSPDAPGMPAPSERTAWDFMPPDWKYLGSRWVPPAGFTPATQLKFARPGRVTPQVRPHAQRDPAPPP